tara:strand:- start:62 stop:316 length:255 start_codon:yes stop_codon:yes gene_type:complete
MFRLETFVLGVVVLEEIVDSLAEEMVSFCDGVVVVVIVVVEGGRATGVVFVDVFVGENGPSNEFGELFDATRAVRAVGRARARR